MPDMNDRLIELLNNIVIRLGGIEEALDNLGDTIAEQNTANLSDEELTKRVLRGQRALARRD